LVVVVEDKEGARVGVGEGEGEGEGEVREGSKKAGRAGIVVRAAGTVGEDEWRGSAAGTQQQQRWLLGPLD
jgi:hypothetical protein